MSQIVRGLLFKSCKDRVAPIQLQMVEPVLNADGTWADPRPTVMPALRSVIGCDHVTRINIATSAELHGNQCASLFCDEEGSRHSDNPTRTWRIVRGDGHLGISPGPGKTVDVSLSGMVIALGEDTSGELAVPCSLSVAGAIRVIDRIITGRNPFADWRPLELQLRMWLVDGVPW